MKDSGIEWIGMIPNDWDTSRVKYLATEKDSLFIDGDWIESDVIVESGIRYLTTGNVGPGYYKEQGSGYISYETFKKLNCLKVLPNDLMISRLNEPIGRACIVPYTEPYYVVAVDNVILRPDGKYDKKYIMYCMNTDGYAEAGREAARGATMQRVSRSLLGGFFVPIAPLPEQKLIVDFLDDKVGQIDEILSYLNKQVEILNQYKKSLITETVTKGLNPNVTMKDTGIDWFGKIPENWVVKRLKYVISGITDGTHGTFDRVNEGELLLSAKNVFEDGLHIGNNESYISESDYKSIIANGYPKKGDVLLCCVGTVGRSTVYQYDKPIAFQRSVIFLRNNELILPEMINYCLQTDGVLVQEKILINKSAQDGLYQGAVKELYLVFPLDKEIQKEIIEFLDKKCCEIDYAIAGKQQQIKRIEKFKKSLIYEYVTGKKRV